MKAIIVGGGCAGLAAAHTIIKNGGDVLVLERESVAGGRMQNYKRDGFTFDMGAQYISPTYQAAMAIINEMGMTEEVIDIALGRTQVYRDGILAYPKFRGSLGDRITTLRWHAKAGLRGTRNTNKLIQFVLARSDRIYEGSVDWFLDLDTEFFADFVRREYGAKVLEYFAQPMVSAFTLADPELMGMGFGLQILWTILCGKAASLKQGIGSLAERVVGQCTGTSQFVHDMPVKRILIEDGRVRGVETDKDTYEADVVVCAVMAPNALAMMPNLPDSMRRPISMVTYSPAITCCFALDMALGPDDPSGGFLPRNSGYLMSSFGFNSVKSPFLSPDGCDSIRCFMYGNRALSMSLKSDEEISQMAFAQLRQLAPKLPERPLFSKVVRWPQANYIMAPGCATGMKQVRENHYRDVEGLFLCGEYMYTGSFESAMASGKAAAEAALGLRETI